MQTPQVPALPYMSPPGFQLLNVACRDCKRTTGDDSADHDTWIDGLCLYCQHAAATQFGCEMAYETAYDAEQARQRSNALENLWHAEGLRVVEQADERADAAERAYNAALERGGSQDDWDAAAETAYEECALRQRQAAEQEYQDNHR